MPKVLHLRTVVGRGGGPEKTLLNSPRFIDPSYTLRLAYLRPEGDPLYDMPARAASVGVDLVDIPERGAIDFRAVQRLKAEIAAFQPDILHAHDYKTNVLGVILGRRSSMPVMTTSHGYGVSGGRLGLYYRIDRWALRRMDRVVVVSDDLQAHMESIGVLPERCRMIENAIDSNAYRRRFQVAEAKRRLGFDPERPLIGAVGRLSDEKGFDLLIEAAGHLLDRGQSLTLVIAGEGPLLAALQAQIQKLGRQNEIRLLGYRSDTIDLYQALDVFVLSSLREASPNVVLEAMSLEAPTIATRIAGVPRIIEDGESGLLIEPNSVPALEEAISRLLNDEGLRERIAAAGRETIESRYSFSVRMDKMRRVYDELLGLPSPPREDACHAPPALTAVRD